MKGRVGGEGARDVGPIREGFRQSLFQPDGPSPDGSGVGGNGKLIERKREDARSALRLATGSDKEGVIKSRGCPHRLVAQDVALSRPKPGFESPWGHRQPAPSESLSWGFSFEIPRIVRQRESFKASRPPSSPATFRLAHAWRKIPSLSTPSRFRWPRICQVPEGAPPGPDSLYCSYRSTRAEAVHTIGEGDSPPHVGSCRNDQAAEPMAQVAQSWAE